MNKNDQPACTITYQLEHPTTPVYLWRIPELFDTEDQAYIAEEQLRLEFPAQYASICARIAQNGCDARWYADHEWRLSVCHFALERLLYPDGTPEELEAQN